MSLSFWTLIMKKKKSLTLTQQINKFKVKFKGVVFGILIVNIWIGRQRTQLQRREHESKVVSSVVFTHSMWLCQNWASETKHHNNWLFYRLCSPVMLVYSTHISPSVTQVSFSSRCFATETNADWCYFFSLWFSHVWLNKQRQTISNNSGCGICTAVYLPPPGGLIRSGSPTRRTCKWEYIFFLQVLRFTLNQKKTHAHTSSCIIFVTVLLVGIYIWDYYTAIIHHILYLGRKSKILLHTTGTAAALFKILFWLFF